MSDDDWRPIETFNIDTHAGRGVLGWFPNCTCVFDMVWTPYDDERHLRRGKAGGHFVPFGGQGRFRKQPTHWREMPAPPR